MSNYILSAFTDEYGPSPEEQLEAMERFEISHTELRFVDGINVSRLPFARGKEIKKSLDAAGVKVSAVGSPLGKIPLDGDIKEHRETAKHVFELCALWGAKLVRVFSFYAPEGGDITREREEVTERLGELIALARPYGIRLCHENEAKIYGDLPCRCRELMEQFPGELGCVFDMGNFVLEGQDPYLAYEQLKEYVTYFHIKDALYKGAIVPPGKGEAKIRQILLSHMAYEKKDFFVSLEPHLQTFSGLNALVGRKFDNPYKFQDEKAAFEVAVRSFRELMS